MSGEVPLRRTWLPWLPLVAVVVLALAIGAFGSTGPATNEERALAINKQIRCPICAGETVAESNTDISRNIRAEVARQVEQGRTDDEVIAAIDQSFPDDALILTPPSSGIAGLVWIIPVVALVASLAGLALAFRRWQVPAEEHASDDDRALVAAALARDQRGQDPESEPS